MNKQPIVFTITVNSDGTLEDLTRRPAELVDSDQNAKSTSHSNPSKKQSETMSPAQIHDLKTAIIEEIKEEFGSVSWKEPKTNLTIDECVEYTGIGRNKMMELAHSTNRGFPSFRVGTKFLVNRKLLNEWLEKVIKEKITL